MTVQILTQERLRDLLIYDELTGVFTNRVTRNPRAKAGEPAGVVSQHGYIVFQIDGKKIYAHRAVWLYMFGEWPDKEIDHINRNRQDNRLVNLRLASRLLNAQNTGKHLKNKSGHKGVVFHKRSGKWQVQMSANSKTFYIGQYDLLGDAVRARSIAEIFLHEVI
jgi:hypothetical protein